MIFILEAFFSGCISKVINDGKDYSWSKIKSAVKDRHDQNISTKICRVIEKSINIVTDNAYKNSDDLYDAIEKIFSEFKNHGDTLESVKCGLNVLGADTNDQRCENFLEKFYEGIRRNDDLYKAIMMDLEQEDIKISQEEFQKLNEKIDNLTEIVSSRNDNENDLQKREPVKSRTQEYADKWNQNMFLNDFDKRDENAGVNVKLKEVYLEEHLPHYIWGENQKISIDLKDLLKEYIYPYYENKMLLILGQPGIGKSTLITWITANFTDKADDILVYRFASDLRDFDWQSARLLNRILEKLGLDYQDLNRKTIILDGLDEVSINNRREVLDGLYDNLIYENRIKEFSLIITCRENYVQERERIRGKYIILQPWDEAQIRSFCDVFQKNTGDNISESTIKKIIESIDILGIPLILYMTLALNISIEKEGSIVDVYDKIFSLDGGIYDRCINNKEFAKKHRIGALKEQIHQVSRDIAIWMFENNPVGAFIPKEEYQNICNAVMHEAHQENNCIQRDFLIGSFFKLVKYCEGVESEELHFVHRSIYEYFVAEAIYNSIKNSMIILSEKSQEELAGNVAIYLKKGCIQYAIASYLQYKILKLYNMLDKEKQRRFYQWWEDTVNKMMESGMFYYTEKKISYFKNIIAAECRCFLNLLEILRLLMEIDNRKNIMENAQGELVEEYVKCCYTEHNRFSSDKIMDLSKMFLQKVNIKGIQLKGFCLNQVNLERADLAYADLSKLALERADLAYADLRGSNLADSTLMQADLRGADLTGSNLNGAKLYEARLVGADLKKADLRGVDLIGAYIEDIYLNGALIDDYQVPHFEKKLKLHNVKIFNNKTQEIVDYDEYCKSKE